MMLPNAITLIVYGIVVGTVFATKDQENKSFVSLGGVTVGLFITIFVGLIAWVVSLNTYESTRETINYEITEEPLQAFSEEDTPVQVSPDSARHLMERSMSNVPNAQFYDLGVIQAQEIEGEPIYVSPIEYNNFWRWLRGTEIPGYFLLSATNPSDQPEFVEHEMNYTRGSYMGDYVTRAIYEESPNFFHHGNPTMEVDEDGKAWYVQTLYERRGFSFQTDFDSLQVAVVDTETGEVSLYETDDAPDFISGTISPRFASEANNVFGQYVHGWLNTMFGQEDVRMPNDNGTEAEVTPIFDEDGNMFYFTDMTSPQENIESALGVTLMNARTGELTYYDGSEYSGIMDSQAASGVVNRTFPEREWRGSMPVLYNISGEPTWVVSVLDPAGLFRQYAYIKADDPDTVAFGETSQEALDAYVTELATSGDEVETSESALDEVSGTIDRVGTVITDDSTVVQFRLEGDDTSYLVSTGTFREAALLESGDEIEFLASIDDATGTVEEMQVYPWNEENEEG
ncbi:DNA-binding protein [Salicibibacter kimchii]|nr:DNA-binding protein [Salicibibacter kimchii]